MDLTNKGIILCSERETNSGLKGVWVYRIGTYPYFSKVKPGEVTDLPTEPPLKDLDSQQSILTSGQVFSAPDAEQIQVHLVQYQPQNPEVVEIEDSEINVDGEFI